MLTGTEILVLALWIPFHHQVHEGLHYTFAKTSGLEVTKYKPYPHVEDNVFYMGQNVVLCKNISKKQCHRKFSVGAMAPHVFNTGLYATSNVAYRLFEDRDKKRLTILLGMVAPLFDTTFNLGASFGRTSDFRHLQTSERILLSAFLISAWINTYYKWQENN